MKKLKLPYKAANPVKLVWLIIFLGFFACLQIAITGWWTTRNMRVERGRLDALNLRLADAKSLLEQRLVQKQWEYRRLLDVDAGEPDQDMEGGKSLQELTREYKDLADSQDLAELFSLLDQRTAELGSIHSQCLHWRLGLMENRRMLPETRRQAMEKLVALEDLFGAYSGKRQARSAGALRKGMEAAEVGFGGKERGTVRAQIAGRKPTALEKGLEELHLLARLLQVGEDAPSLLVLKNQGERQSLAGLHSAVRMLQGNDPADAAAAGALLSEFEKVLFGKGYAVESGGNRIIPGLGGFFNQTVDRLQFLLERDRLQETMLRKFDELSGTLRDVVVGVEGASKAKAQRLEQLLKKAWLTILVVAFSAAMVFLVVSVRIISEIRKQIATIEEANLVLDARTKELLQSQEELSGANERLEHLSCSLLSAQEDEQRRISRELHDELGQAMAALKLQVRAAEKTLGAEAPAPLKIECEKLRSQINQIIENVRRLSRDLSPVVLEDLGLEAAVRYLAENFLRFHNLKIDLDLQEIIHLVSEDKQRNVYRILQELLNNVAKHAEARHVSIVVRHIKNFLRITVTDDGRGFDVNGVRKRQAAERGLGLEAMTERVRILGGVLDIESRPGEGTTVNFTAPI